MIPLFCHVQVPAFETKDGKCIYESNAIAYYGMFLYGHISYFYWNDVLNLLPSWTGKALYYAHMAHKAMKWCILKVLAGLRCSQVAKQLVKYSFFVEGIFICEMFSVMMNKHEGYHDAIVL